MTRGIIEGPAAQVAKLVDALVSGTSSRKGVKVRVLSWAPAIYFAATSDLTEASSAVSQPGIVP